MFFLLRRLVSTNKRRLKKHGLDLDLAYITCACKMRGWGQACAVAGEGHRLSLRVPSHARHPWCNRKLKQCHNGADTTSGVFRSCGTTRLLFPSNAYTITHTHTRIMHTVHTGPHPVRHPVPHLHVGSSAQKGSLGVPPAELEHSGLCGQLCGVGAGAVPVLHMHVGTQEGRGH